MHKALTSKFVFVFLMTLSSKIVRFWNYKTWIKKYNFSYDCISFLDIVSKGIIKLILMHDNIKMNCDSSKCSTLVLLYKSC